jgi:hypothetical protein
MTTLKQRAQFEACHTASLKGQILAQIKSGEIKNTPRSWEDLHDQVADGCYDNLLDDAEWAKFCANFDNKEQALAALDRINADVEAWMLTL